jgi:hypothetical protein
MVMPDLPATDVSGARTPVVIGIAPRISDVNSIPIPVDGHTGSIDPGSRCTITPNTAGMLQFSTFAAGAASASFT